MTRLNYTWILIVLPFVLSCQASTKKELASYEDTPYFIKSFLDFNSNGKFWVAGKGQSWNASCITNSSKPQGQFISAFVDTLKGVYKLNILIGSNGHIRPRAIIVFFEGHKILRCSIEDDLIGSKTFYVANK
ncbi:MAG: hypothetical protein IPP73_18640 [Chitinophagaceae bacterium]|nr:hypothetical protein [Chitinophagaceae bacterium]